MRSLKEKLEAFKDEELASLEESLGIEKDTEEDDEDTEDGIRVADDIRPEEDNDHEADTVDEEAYLDAEEAIDEARTRVAELEQDPEELRDALADVAGNLEQLLHRKQETTAQAADDADRLEAAGRKTDTAMERPRTERAGDIEEDISTHLHKVKQLISKVTEDVKHGRGDK